MEEAYRFGKADCLTGIVAAPEAGKAIPNAPAVIILNAGLLHRVGPYRLGTHLARTLAGLGYPSLRFDLSGLGDSDLRTDLQSYQQRAVEDTIDAMDFVSAETGATRFVLIGFCSGADHAHRIVCVDPRVVGVVFLDAYGYRTPRFYFHYYARRARRGAFKIGKWKRLWARIRQNGNGTTNADGGEDLFPRCFPPKDKVRSDLLNLMDRGAHLLYVYTSGIEENYVYARQFEDMLRLKPKAFGGQLQVEFFKNTDHMYTLLEDRSRLTNTISRWMLAHYQHNDTGVCRD
jgi:pimeloyl-ACP methyl ester carboxylesterase